MKIPENLFVFDKLAEKLTRETLILDSSGHSNKDPAELKILALFQIKYWSTNWGGKIVFSTFFMFLHQTPMDELLSETYKLWVGKWNMKGQVGVSKVSHFARGMSPSVAGEINTPVNT